MDNYEQTAKLWGEITETLSKLSLIAAGTISLSITFLGYILSAETTGVSSRSILHAPLVLGIPTIYLLFLSWILLFVAMFLGIIARLPNAWYLFNTHINLWFTGLAQKTPNGDEKNYQFVADAAKTGQDKYHRLNDIVRWITIILFALGILSLLIFAIVVSNGLTH